MSKQLNIRKIRTQKQLRKMRRNLDLQVWYAGDKLVEEIEDFFSLSNLLALVMPAGTRAGLMVRGLDTGISMVQKFIGRGRR